MRNEKFGFLPHARPVESLHDKGAVFYCVCPRAQDELFACDRRNVIHGDIDPVTGASGMACASIAVNHFDHVIA